MCWPVVGRGPYLAPPANGVQRAPPRPLPGNSRAGPRPDSQRQARRPTPKTQPPALVTVHGHHTPSGVPHAPPGLIPSFSAYLRTPRILSMPTQPPRHHACVTTTGSEAAAAARIGAALGRRNRAELLGLLRPCFARMEPWLQARKYAGALMSQIPRRNGWTIAEHAGDRAPDKTQRLLNRAVWDTAGAPRSSGRWARR